nr:MAG TPA: hypothetical protein [Caudoviricetes sp.]
MCKPIRYSTPNRKKSQIDSIRTTSPTPNKEKSLNNTYTHKPTYNI